MGGCIQGGYRDSACPGLPCPIHTRHAYLLRSPNPLLDHCVHPPLTQPQEQVSLSHPPFTYHSLIHPCVHLFVCVHTQPPKSVGLWTSTHGQVCLPCTTVWILALIHHISTQMLSRGPQVQVSRELYLYPGFCQDVIPGSCLFGDLQMPRPLLLWVPWGPLMTLISNHRSGQEERLPAQHANSCHESQESTNHQRDTFAPVALNDSGGLPRKWSLVVQWL